MHGIRIVVYPLGCTSRKCTFELGCGVLCCAERFYSSGAKLLQEVNALLDCFESQERLEGARDCLLDLAAGILAGIAHIVQVVGGIIRTVPYVILGLARSAQGLDQVVADEVDGIFESIRNARGLGHDVGRPGIDFAFGEVKRARYAGTEALGDAVPRFQAVSCCAAEGSSQTVHLFWQISRLGAGSIRTVPHILQTIAQGPQRIGCSAGVTHKLGNVLAGIVPLAAHFPCFLPRRICAGREVAHSFGSLVAGLAKGLDGIRCRLARRHSAGAKALRSHLHCANMLFQTRHLIVKVLNRA